METKVKRVRIRYSEIVLDDENILWIKPDEDASFDLEEVEACFKAYTLLGINKENKVLQIIDAQTNISMDKEGREYAAKHGRDFFLASAVISKSLSVILIVNFFNVFYKQPVPFKLFDSEIKAKKWLEKFKK